MISIKIRLNIHSGMWTEHKSKGYEIMGRNEEIWGERSN